MFHAGELTVDLAGHLVKVGSQEAHLTATEFGILRRNEGVSDSERAWSWIPIAQFERLNAGVHVSGPGTKEILRDLSLPKLWRE